MHKLNTEKLVKLIAKLNNQIHTTVTNKKKNNKL